jgi:NOL1/NOP2/fmu family ribosome biogenesis protein
MAHDTIDRARTLASSLRIIASGVTVGVFNKGIMIPDHGLSLSSVISPAIPTADLSLKQALLYLKKELSAVDLESTSWHIATYQGLGLGWFKNLGSRINNYLPNELRILKSLAELDLDEE